MAISLLCHFDGTNGSTDIIDETGNTTFTIAGSAALSNAGQIFGTACLHLNSGFVYSNHAIDFFTNDLTIRFRYTPTLTDLTGFKTLAQFTGTIVFLDNGELWAGYYFADLNDKYVSLGFLTANTEYAVSIEAYGGNLYSYLQGFLINSDTRSGAFWYDYRSQTGLGDPFSAVTGNVDELLVDNGTSYAQGAASYTVETSPFSLGTNPQITQSFSSTSSASGIDIAQGFYSASSVSVIGITQAFYSSVYPQIKQLFSSKSAKNSVIGLGGMSASSSVPNYEPIEITQSIESVSTVSIIDLNTEPMAVKSWSAKSVLLNLGRLTAFSKSAKSGFVELGAIKAFSKSAKATIASLPSLTMSSKSGGLSKITNKLSVFSASSIAVIGSVVNLGKLSVSSVSAKASRVTLPSLSVFSVSAGVTLIKQKLDIAKELVSSVVAYAMNTKTAQLTKYTNFDFLAIIRLGNKHYGVKPTGLYEFTGNTDNGTAIDARFTTHETDYGTNKLKNVAHVYLDSEDPSYTMAIVDGVEKTEQPSSFGGRKTKLARGTLGRWWQYRIRNRNAKLRVAGIEVLVEERDRRIN